MRGPAVLYLLHQFVGQLLILWSSPRFEMQDTGVTYEGTLKNLALVPYFLDSCQTEAALSVPA